MNSFLILCRTLFGYLVVGIMGVVCFVPCVFVACLPEKYRFDNRLYYGAVALFFRVIVWATFLHIKIEGKENIPNEPGIIIANHQSALDIPMLGSLVGTMPHIWLFLKKYTKYPIFGFVARRMNVVVDSSGLRKLVGSIEKAGRLIQGQHRHVLLFPEGGRHIDGSVHRFFYGFAILAQESKRPVIPVIMFNLGKIYPPGAFLLRPHPVKISIGKPFVFEENDTYETFSNRVHAWFVKQVETNSL